MIDVNPSTATTTAAIPTTATRPSGTVQRRVKKGKDCVRCGSGTPHQQNP